MDLLTIIIIAAVAVVVALVGINTYGRLLRKVGPNQALIVFGQGGTKVITGGSHFVVPLYQRAQEFSLELMSFDVAPPQDLYTTQGVAVNVEAVTQIKVRSDQESVKTAAEQFLSKPQDIRENLIRLVMEGHLRGIVGQLTVEELVKEPENVGEKMLKTVTPDMEKMGLEVISFTIKDVRDKNQYIDNMGRPQTAQIKKQADIALALALRDTQIQQANAQREAAVAKAAADQERVKAETESLALQAASQRNLSLKKAEFDAEVKKQQIKVQQAEIQRRELELQATIQKAAEAERRRVETVAEAERQRLIFEAQGQADAAKARGIGDAEAARAKGLAEAEVVRAKGLAEAEVIRAKGEAEADAMKVKAAAYHEYNQAAVLDKLLTNMPEMVRAIAEPLSKVDKVTIVSTGGNGANNGLGASRLTGDIVNMAAQIPALFELLSGTRIGDLMSRVPALATRDDQNNTDATKANGAGPTVEAAPGEK